MKVSGISNWLISGYTDNEWKHRKHVAVLWARLYLFLHNIFEIKR